MAKDKKEKQRRLEQGEREKAEREGAEGGSDKGMEEPVTAFTERETKDTDFTVYGSYAEVLEVNRESYRAPENEAAFAAAVHRGIGNARLTEV